jgi:AraC-like DNA-binding protein
MSGITEHFRALTSMVPIQFQKQICLHEARTRLLAEPGDIAGAGFAVGYDSPSQFSREYRRMFGVPPSRDALTLRQTAGSGRFWRDAGGVAARRTIAAGAGCLSLAANPAAATWCCTAANPARKPSCGRMPTGRC